MKINEHISVSFIWKWGFVYCNLQYNGRSKRFSTKIRIPKEEFSNGWIHPKSSAGKIAEQNLRDYLKRIEQLNISSKYTIGTIANLISGKEKERAFDFTLLSSLRYGLESSKNISAKNTIENYTFTLSCFTNFLSKEGYEDVSPSGISIGLAKRYRDYLLNFLENSPSTASGKLSNLSSMYNTFVCDHEDDLDIPENPFPAAKMSIRRLMRDSIHKNQIRIQEYSLSEDQLKLIFNYPISKKEERYLDMVKWQNLTGFAFDDMLYYNWKVKESDGNRFIILDRGKTKKLATIPMLNETCKLYEQLNKEYGDRIFPVDTDLPRRTYYNRYYDFLVSFSKKTGIYLRSHLFRHTFGMLMSKAGIPMADIADMLGHSTSVTTEKFYVAPKAEDLIHRSNIQLKKGLIDFT